MSKFVKSVLATAVASVSLSAASVDLESDAYYQAGKAFVENALKKEMNEEMGAAKNVILFVGDGMGISTVTAARIWDGQNKGMTGEENSLSFGEFPYTGFSKTYNVDAQTPDSAGTMTAIVTGEKTNIGILGVTAAVDRGDCQASLEEGNQLTTILETAEEKGKSTGIISTARITHATPAGTYAKSADRNYESSAPEGCKDIATQLVEFDKGDGIDVVMGGGRRNFISSDVTDLEGKSGRRSDGVDLTAVWQDMYPEGVYIEDQAGFDSLTGSESKVMGLFNSSHMQYEADRVNDVAGEPSIAEMTEKAISILNNNDDGFFLMVEGGRIDHAHHAGNAYGALADTVALSEAVAIADEMTNDSDTLIIVTADHGHVFTIGGYPKRGNPILGKAVAVGEEEPTLAEDGLPYTTVQYTNGLGFADYGSETDSDARYAEDAVAGRVDLTNVDTTAPGFHQEALVPLGSETHSAEDVGIFAKGPGAHRIVGVIEQNEIFDAMAESADLASE